MTDSRCIPIEELARVRELPAGAPERAHVDACPRCRASLLALEEFEHADERLPAEAGAAGARAKLDALIETLTTAPAPASRSRESAGWLQRLFAPPAVRFAAGFAIVALIAASAWLVLRPPGGGTAPGERIVRGEAAPSGEARLETVTGGWALTWPAVAGAETYDVVFLDADLHELARVPAVAGTRLALERDALPAGLSPGATVLVEVDAMAGGGVLFASVPVPIVLS